jgi:hypothetical protein
MTTPTPGDFTWYPDEQPIRDILKNMFDAVTKLNLWDWLRDFNPNPEDGLQFSESSEIDALSKETEDMGHSGVSFGYCLGNMSKIAKIGWTEYYNTITSSKTTAEQPSS